MLFSIKWGITKPLPQSVPLFKSYLPPASVSYNSLPSLIRRAALGRNRLPPCLSQCYITCQRESDLGQILVSTHFSFIKLTRYFKTACLLSEYSALSTCKSFIPWFGSENSCVLQDSPTVLLDSHGHNYSFLSLHHRLPVCFVCILQYFMDNIFDEFWEDKHSISYFSFNNE